MDKILQVKHLESEQLHFLENKINKFKKHLYSKIFSKLNVPKIQNLQDQIQESNVVSSTEIKEEITQFLQNPMRILQREFRFTEQNTQPVLFSINLLSHVPPAKLDQILSKLSKQITHEDISPQDVQKISLYLNCLSDCYLKF